MHLLKREYDPGVAPCGHGFPLDGVALPLDGLYWRPEIDRCHGKDAVAVYSQRSIPPCHSGPSPHLGTRPYHLDSISKIGRCKGIKGANCFAPVSDIDALEWAGPCNIYF